MPPEGRHPGTRAVWPGRGARTASPSLRVQQPLPAILRGPGPGGLGQIDGRPAGGNRRAAATAAPLVPGLSGTSGVHLHPARWPSAVHRLRALRAGVQGGARQSQAGAGVDRMKLCGFDVGLNQPLFLIAGPCVVESEQLQLDTAGTLKEITGRLGIPFIFKSSFDKANRTSNKSFRGLGMEEGLRILGEVKKQVGVPVLTDVHEYTPFDGVAEVVDVLQTPAFLCRQTDFIQKVARVGRPVNIKKGQFLSPWDMKNVVEKARAVGNDRILMCERGASFGYNNLVSDMRSLAVMRDTGCPVVFDATHSVQLPGGQGNKSGGQREFVPVLARAAVAVGVAGVFMETHPDPDQALSDGPNAWPLGKMEALLETLVALDSATKRAGFLEVAHK